MADRPAANITYYTRTKSSVCSSPNILLGIRDGSVGNVLDDRDLFLNRNRDLSSAGHPQTGSCTHSSSY
jgi:hypothetical protein